MTISQMRLVQTSWKTVTRTTATQNQQLWRQLVCIIPELKGFLLPDAAHEPGRKLLLLLHRMLCRLDSGAGLFYDAQCLGYRYLNNALRDDQYILAGRLLLQTLATRLGEKWNGEMADAWAHCYTTLAEEIRNATHNHHETFFPC